jgi:hypothetical protein
VSRGASLLRPVHDATNGSEDFVGAGGARHNALQVSDINVVDKALSEAGVTIASRAVEGQAGRKMSLCRFSRRQQWQQALVS